MTTLSTPFTWTSEKTESKPSRFKGIFAALMHEIRVRRALREVSGFDDATLHDIGIDRGSIEDAVRYGRH
jgi:uncharacterized protein YjiS (DUF1127 family)